MLQKVGIRKFFNYIIQIEQEKKKTGPSSLFEIFLETLVERNIFTKVSLRKLLDEEAHRPGPPSYLLTSRKSLSKFEGSFSSLSLSPLITSETDFKKTVFSKPSLFSLKSEPLIGHDLFQEEEEGISNKHNSSPVKSIKQAHPTENLENPPNYSEVSELAVSSYSVSSNYFKDYSEDFSASPREHFGYKFAECVDSTPPDSLKASSFPEKASPLNNPSLRSLRSIKRGVSQPARGRAAVDSRNPENLLMLEEVEMLKCLLSCKREAWKKMF